MSASDRADPKPFAPAQGEGRSRGLAGELSVLRRHWLLISIVVLATMLVFAAVHVHKAKSYTATASVTFQNSTLSGAALNIATSGSSEPQREADTQVLIAHSTEVAQAVRKQLKLSATAPELPGRGQGRSGAHGKRAERERHQRQPAASGGPRQRIRRAVHRLPRRLATRRRGHRGGGNAQADQRTAESVPRTRQPFTGTRRARADPGTARLPACGRERRRERHQQRDGAHEAPTAAASPRPWRSACSWAWRLRCR